MTNPADRPEASRTTEASGAGDAAEPKAAAKQKAWLRYARATERSLDDALWLPPGLYLLALFTGDHGLGAFAWAAWAVGALMWSQWIPSRVGKRAPPGDAPLAMAWVGLGLLGLPLSILVLIIAPEGSRAMFGFPVAFVWCGVFLLIAGLYEAPTPAALRRRVLDSGVVAYMGQAVIAGAGAVFLVTQEDFLHPVLVDYAGLAAPASLVLGIILGLVGMRLAGDAKVPPEPRWIAGEDSGAKAQSRQPEAS